MARTVEAATQRREELERPVRVGVFIDVHGADCAVAKLSADGFTREELSVMCSDEAVERHFREFEHQKPAGAHTPAAALTGGALGATLGGLAAVAGMITTGGVAVLAAGALAAWAGGVVGGLVGAMMTRGVEKELANYYDQALTAGKILVAVDVKGKDAAARRAQAERVFVECGAEPVRLPEG
jgi:hypothetical protein